MARTITPLLELIGVSRHRRIGEQVRRGQLVFRRPAVRAKSRSKPARRARVLETIARRRIGFDRRRDGFVRPARRQSGSAERALVCRPVGRQRLPIAAERVAQPARKISAPQKMIPANLNTRQLCGMEMRTQAVSISSYDLIVRAIDYDRITSACLPDLRHDCE